MRLQSDEARCRVGLPAVCIAVHEVGLLLSIQKNGKSIVLDANLERVPLPGTVGRDAFIQRLASNVVDRSGGAKLLVDGLSGRRIAPPERIDLHFESEVDGDEGGVVVVNTGRVGESKKDAGIV